MLISHRAAETLAPVGDAAMPARAEPRRVPAEPGLWVLLFGDMVVFTVLFTVYLGHRTKDASLFARSQGLLDRTIGATNTAVLLTSSLLVVLGTAAMRRHQTQRARWLLFGGALVGSCFVAFKAHEYHALFTAGITPSTNDFFMYYFVLTGLHLAHVIVGLILLTALASTANRPSPSPAHIAFVEGGACFWHMVDLLWIVIFPLIFLVR